MKTSDSDFALFKEECGRWIEYFGLKQWSVSFEHMRKDSVLAQVSYNFESKGCLLRLSLEWPGENFKLGIESEHIKRAAFHEVVHILIAGLVNCAESRYTTQTEIDESEHVIIRTLENTLFKQNTKRLL